MKTTQCDSRTYIQYAHTCAHTHLRTFSVTIEIEGKKWINSQKQPRRYNQRELIAEHVLKNHWQCACSCQDKSFYSCGFVLLRVTHLCIHTYIYFFFFFSNPPNAAQRTDKIASLRNSNNLITCIIVPVRLVPHTANTLLLFICASVDLHFFFTYLPKKFSHCFWL